MTFETRLSKALRPKRKKARRGRVLDPKYLAWIRTLECCVPGCTSKNLHKWDKAAGSITEAAHVGERGLSQKSSDRETIPLCAHCHRTGKESHHVMQKRFWEHHGLDRDKLIAELNARYDALHGCPVR